MKMENGVVIFSEEETKVMREVMEETETWRECQNTWDYRANKIMEIMNKTSRSKHI